MGFKSIFKSILTELHTVKSTDPIGANNVFSMFNNNRKVAGVVVNQNTAIQHSTVYACIRDKAESIGQLPVKLYRTTNGKKEEVTSGREHRIFTQRPNDFQTMQDFIEMMETSLELNGKFFAYVNRNDRGSISEILPFRNQRSVSVNMDINGNVYYTYTTNDNKPAMGFAENKILHIKLNTLDGFTGLSPIQCNARALGLAISQEVHLSSLMEDGAMPVGVLETDQIFDDEDAIKRLQDDWRVKYGGTKNSGKTPILENGLKYRPLTISPADTQLIEQRQYSREELCGIFRVPPHRIGASTGAKKEDIEQANKDYYINKLMPIVTKYEMAMNWILPDNLTIKLDEKGFIRGDAKTQAEVVGAEFKIGSISMNEVRKDMGREPIEGGEVHAIDTNNLTFGLLTDIPKLQEEKRALALAGSQNTNKPKDDNNEA